MEIELLKVIMKKRSFMHIGRLLLCASVLAPLKPVEAARIVYARAVVHTVAQNKPGLAQLPVTPASKVTANAAPASALEEKSDIQSFVEWKQEKVKDAVQKLDEARRDQSSAPSKDNSNESKIYQAEWNLETAQELEITDYIVLYLSQFAGTKKFEEAASRLTKNEVAMVMEKYISIIQKGNRQRPSPTDAKAASLPAKKPAQAFGY